ncbi:MAG: molybdopterin molybdotransferase MoeA [Helicobacteraceae bacterium]|jgi:molybdopterin molybdotransferase|nr:molybdopterin molybdotransferase MoeA [Helicobacteraceae bacterium]
MTKTSFSISEALALLLSKIEPNAQSESVALFSCAGRALAEDITARRALPPFDNSAMDGYAIKLADAGAIARVTDTVFAGSAPAKAVGKGEAIKIMTGAGVPEGAEAIVMIEHIEIVGENLIKLPSAIAPNQHIRLAGEEFGAGVKLLRAGERLNAVKTALLASQGIMSASVYKRLKIAVISSGDELVEPWQTPAPFQIFNSNAAAIALSLEEAGFETSYEGLGGDDPALLAQMIQKALAANDALVVTGGVSAGDADYSRRVFESLNAEIFFHGLNFKPGKPTMAGRVFGKPFFALPGNPMSALANLYMLALPAFRKLQGDLAVYSDFCVAENAEPFEIKGDRDTAFLGVLKSGRWRITRGGKYGSGMLLPLAKSDSFAIFSKSVREVKAGEAIKVIPLDRFPGVAPDDPINR